MSGGGAAARGGPGPRIDAYHFGQVVVAGEVHRRDVIILPDGVIGNWWREEGHVLHSGDLEEVFAAGPEVLVVGRGSFGRMRVADETREALAAAGIELVALSTGEAIEAYNGMREECAAAAALHLTC